jgi:hypothetical protein
VVRKVPRKLKDMFGRLARVILHKLLETCESADADDPVLVAAWRAFLELPSKVLSYDATRNTRQAKEYMAKVLDKVSSDGLAAFHQIPDFAPRRPRAQVVRDAEKLRIDRASRLVREGEFARAVATLMRPGIHPMTEERVEEIASLFPENPVRPEVAIKPEGPSQEWFSSKATRFLAKEIKSSHGTCPGPTHWSPEMVKVLWSDNNNKAPVVELIRRIPTTSGVVREWLLGASVIPAMKPDSVKCRPICPMEVWYKLHIKSMMDIIGKDKIAELFPDIQLGVGKRGGIDILVRATQVALASNEELCALKIDAINAYGTISQNVHFAALSQIPSLAPLAGSVAWAYGTPRPVICRMHTGEPRCCTHSRSRRVTRTPRWDSPSRLRACTRR